MNMPIPDDRQILEFSGRRNPSGSANSQQVGGSHYSRHNPQPWDVYENWFGREGFLGYLKGTIVKYLVRYPNKGGVEDLLKAKHFLEKLIEAETAQGETRG